eukprot:g4460.t1
MALHIGADGVLTEGGREVNPRRLHADVTPIMCRDVTPASRCGAASFTHGRRFYVFGGHGGSLGPHASDQLFSIEMRGGTSDSGWTRVRCGSKLGAGPPARSECTAVVVPGGDSAYIFGGQNAAKASPTATTSRRREIFDDTWEFNLTTSTWSRMQTHPGHGAERCYPPARRGHSAVCTPEGAMLVFGGIGLERSFACETYLNCVWGLDLNTGAWCRAPPKGTNADAPQHPSPRAFHTATLIKDSNSKKNKQSGRPIAGKYRMVVIGGMGASFHSSSSGPQMQMASVGQSVFAPDTLHVLNISICGGVKDSNAEKPSKHGSELWADVSWNTPANVQGESCGSRYGHSAVSFQNGESTNILVFVTIYSIQRVYAKYSETGEQQEAAVSGARP